MTRSVLVELSEAWRDIFAEVTAYQRRNPDVRAAALAGPTDSPEAGRAAIALWATLHPQVLASMSAYCDAVIDELRYLDDGIAVTPACEHAFVSGDETNVGGGQQHDRAATIEERVAAVERRQKVIDELADEVRRRLAAQAGDG